MKLFTAPGPTQRFPSARILARYYEQIAQSGHSRLTVPESAALSYQGILDGAQQIDELHLADEVEVYRRGEFETRYHDGLTGDGTWRSGTGGLHSALEQERSRPLTPGEIGQFRDKQQRLREVAGVEHQDELSTIDNLLKPLIQTREKPQ
ncbi:MAG: hypothetical protein ACRDR6_03700 [Pseudonocardiaceae bacterium]